VGTNKDMCDHDCADVSMYGGHFFQVPKDWEVKSSTVGHVLFQSFQSNKKVHMLILTFSTITCSMVILCLAKVIFLQNVCIMCVWHIFYLVAIQNG